MTKYEELTEAIQTGNKDKCKSLLDAGTVIFPEDLNYPHMRLAVEAKSPDLIELLFQYEEACEFMTDCEAMLKAMATSPNALLALMNTPQWHNEVDSTAMNFYVVEWAVAIGDIDLVAALFCDPPIGESAEAYVHAMRQAIVSDNAIIAQLIIAFWEQDEEALESFFPGTGDCNCDDDYCECDDEDTDDNSEEESLEKISEDFYRTAITAAKDGNTGILMVMMKWQGFRDKEVISQAIKAAAEASHPNTADFLRSL